jgi:hypothetical protein
VQDRHKAVKRPVKNAAFKLAYFSRCPPKGLTPKLMKNDNPAGHPNY